MINCEVCVHIKHVSESVNSVGLLHEGMFSNFEMKCLDIYPAGTVDLPKTIETFIYNRLAFLNKP